MVWMYAGKGAWLPGVPARDLSEAEFERHRVVIEAAAAAGHVLYVQEPDAKAGKLVSADALFVDAALDGVLDYVTVDKVRQWQADAAALVAHQVGEGEVDNG